MAEADIGCGGSNHSPRAGLSVMLARKKRPSVAQVSRRRYSAGSRLRRTTVAMAGLRPAAPSNSIRT